MARVARAKCASCGTWLYLRVLDKPCPLCGDSECWVDAEGYVHCYGTTVGEGLILDPTGRKDGRLVCATCLDQFEAYASTLVLVAPGQEGVRVRHMDGLVYDPDECWGSLDRSLARAGGAVVAGTRWVRTDPWRGYFHGPEGPRGWVKALDGWHSTLENSDFARAVSAITRGREHLPFPVVVSFPRTSNVCAVGIEIYCRRRDARALRDRLEGRTAAGSYWFREVA